MEKMANLLPVKIAGYGRLKNFSLRKNLHLLALIVILLTAAFLRLYKISDYMTFLGDEGRDVLVVRGILQGDFTLLGPRASAGDFFLGPIYYYFMAPFLFLFRYDPVGPAVMVALFGIATVYLVYKVGSEFFNKQTGLFAAALYAVSPLVIAYSRSSWNPNLMPFTSLLTIYFLYKAVISTSWRYFFVVGLLLGISMQLHYLTTFLTVIIGVYILIAKRILDGRLRLFSICKNYVQVLAGFAVGISPFLAFELKHWFPNTKTILQFIFANITDTTYEFNNSFGTIVKDVFFRLFGRLVTRFPPPEQVAVHTDVTTEGWYYATLLLGIVSLGIFLFRYVHIERKESPAFLRMTLLLIWGVVGVLLFGVYKQSIYDYYFSFLFPLPFFLVGYTIASVYQSSHLRSIGKMTALVVFGLLLFINLQGAPFWYAPNKQKEQVQMIAEFVLSKADNKPFNFALITPGNSDHGYRYFFSLNNRNPVTIENPQKDPMRKSVTDQLLIVCENPNCKPLGDSLWEVAGFGRAEIAGVWDVSVVKVYKLVAYEENRIR